MTEVTNLQELREVNVLNMLDGEIYYTKGHTTAGDGGGGIFMWKIGDPFLNGKRYQADNNGTILKTRSTEEDIGRWVRQYDGFISVVYFGAFGGTQDYTVAFQNAINFAAINAKNNPELKGSVVYIPNGNYQISKLLLKNGISILGENIEKTFIQTVDNHSVEYMFTTEPGEKFLHISNLSIFGRESDSGCFLFEDGLWNSTIKNVKILNFKGNGIYLKTNESSKFPNQFNIFENVRINKLSDFANCLKISGQTGQTTFLNCTFDGLYNKAGDVYSRGHNVNISHAGDDTTGVMSFINCSFQQGDYGIYMDYAENVNIDTCWFERLGVAITVDGAQSNTCRNITIQNNRFADAAGYGVLPASPDNIKEGQCISVIKSYVNIYNNYVAVGSLDIGFLNPNSSFVLAFDTIEGGVAIADNVFQHDMLGKTYGIMRVVEVNASNEIRCSRHKLVFVNASTTIVKSIISSISASETITIRANGSSVTFDSTGNIYLISQPTLTISNGEIAVFMKIDIPFNSSYETYQLISVIRHTDVF